MSDLEFLHSPASIAVVGASDDPEKIGGRPLRYLREFGFEGTVVAVNPRRESVQGIPSVPRLGLSPVVPDVALIAVPGQAAVDAVGEAARMGCRAAIVMASGFGETHTAEGRRLQAEMIGHARRAGMRIVGPNSQGLASFHSGAVMGFSTLFTEDPPADGPVGIVSQSGALASVPYGILRRRGIGIRYAHGTGNDIDVTAAELAASAVTDPALRLLLLYLEDVGDAESLVTLGEASRAHDVPVVALVGGRSVSGSRAAASHTGALATERRVLDAFLERIGIWQVHSVRELVAASELYLQDWKVQDRDDTDGSGLVVVSNSGACCVLAADAAEDEKLPMAELAEETIEALDVELPTFAATSNPVDVTAALLTDSGLFGKVLPILGQDPAVHGCLLAVPVAGRGYDVERFARDAAEFARTGMPLVLAVPQPDVARPFVAAGLPVFEEEASAVSALSQFLAHRRRMRRADTLPRPAVGRRESAERPRLTEAESLARLRELGVPVAPHEAVSDVDAAVAARERLGGGPVVVKGSTRDATHKSDLGLVRLGCTTSEDVRRAALEILDSAREHAVPLEGLLVSSMVDGLHEGLLGASLDPVFGPVVLVGAGGLDVETLPDTRVLLAPCTPAEAREAIAGLRMAPVLAGTRGRPAVDVEAWVEAVVQVSKHLAEPGSLVAGFDANPIMLLEEGVVAVDAVVIER